MPVTHDRPQPGPGYWQASDGHWYPPHAHPGPPPAQGPTVVYVQTRGKGMAVAGFVCALVGFVFGLIPLLAVPALILGVLGLTFGSVAWKRATRRRTSKGMAIAAVVLGLLAVTLSIVGFIVVANAFK